MKGTADIAQRWIITVSELPDTLNDCEECSRPARYIVGNGLGNVRACKRHTVKLLMAATDTVENAPTVA